MLTDVGWALTKLTKLEACASAVRWQLGLFVFYGRVSCERCLGSPFEIWFWRAPLFLQFIPICQRRRYLRKISSIWALFFFFLFGRRCWQLSAKAIRFSPGRYNTVSLTVVGRCCPVLVQFSITRRSWVGLVVFFRAWLRVPLLQTEMRLLYVRAGGQHGIGWGSAGIGACCTASSLWMA